MTEDHSTTDRLDAEGVACGLTETQAERRRERVNAELLPHLEAVEDHDRGVTLTFEGTDEAAAAMTEFARLERRCCSFAQFDLTLTPGSESNRLEISGEGTRAMFEQGLKPLVLEYNPELLA